MWDRHFQLYIINMSALTNWVQVSTFPQISADISQQKVWTEIPLPNENIMQIYKYLSLIEWMNFLPNEHLNVSHTYSTCHFEYDYK